MARTAEFERDQVLTEAMKVFWQHGYSRTSMRDLTQATRLNPGSLYSTFKNKQGVFLEAIDLYSQALRRETDAILGHEGDAAQRIQRFFDYLLDGTQRDPDNKGCLLVNTLLEAPADEPELRRRAGEALEYVEGQFRTVLADGQTEGVIRATSRPEDQARLLMTGIFGMRVYSRMPDGRTHARGIVKSLLDAVIAPA